MCVQNDRYTVGGSEMFDTLTDLVDQYKRKGIEEISGNWVYLKQVSKSSTRCSSVSCPHTANIIYPWLMAHRLLSAVLLHQGEFGRHRQQGETAGPDLGAGAGRRGTEEQGGLLGGV